MKHKPCTPLYPEKEQNTEVRTKDPNASGTSSRVNRCINEGKNSFLTCNSCVSPSLVHTITLCLSILLAEKQIGGFWVLCNFLGF